MVPLRKAIVIDMKAFAERRVEKRGVELGNLLKLLAGRDCGPMFPKVRKLIINRFRRLLPRISGRSKYLRVEVCFGLDRDWFGRRIVLVLEILDSG